MPFRLSVEDGRYVQSLDVRSGRLTVGSSPACRLVLASPGISRRHASFRQVGTRVEVEDLGSRVGVRVGGEKVKRALLGPGDTAQLGWARVGVVDVTPETPAAVPAAVDPAARRPGPVLSAAPADPGDFSDAVWRAARTTPWWAASLALHAAAFLVLQETGLWSQEGWRETEAVVTLEGGELPAVLAEDGPHEEVRDPLDAMERPEPSLDIEPPRPPEERETAAEADVRPPSPLDLDRAGRIDVPADAVIGPAPSAPARGDLGATFGKDDAGRANATAAAALADERFARAVLGGLRVRATRENVLVVKGDYDQCEGVLGAWRLDHGWLRIEDLARAMPPACVRAIVWNCSGRSPPPSALAHLEQWVRGGGYLLTSDWSVEFVLSRAFPGYLAPLRRGPQLVMTPDETITFAVAGKHPLLRGLPPEDETSRWWLEDSTIPFTAAPGNGVEVLIRSADLERRHGTDAVAATFPYGRGRVVHVLGHLYQKEGNLRGAVAMQRLLLNFLHDAIRRS